MGLMSVRPGLPELSRKPVEFSNNSIANMFFPPIAHLRPPPLLRAPGVNQASSSQSIFPAIVVVPQTQTFIHALSTTAGPAISMLPVFSQPRVQTSISFSRPRCVAHVPLPANTLIGVPLQLLDNGVMLLPREIMDKVDKTRPVVLKINGMRQVVSPSAFQLTPEGYRVSIPSLLKQAQLTGNKIGIGGGLASADPGHSVAANGGGKINGRTVVILNKGGRWQLRGDSLAAGDGVITDNSIDDDDCCIIDCSLVTSSGTKRGANPLTRITNQVCGIDTSHMSPVMVTPEVLGSVTVTPEVLGSVTVTPEVLTEVRGSETSVISSYMAVSTMNVSSSSVNGSSTEQIVDTDILESSRHTLMFDLEDAIAMCLEDAPAVSLDSEVSHLSTSNCVTSQQTMTHSVVSLPGVSLPGSTGVILPGVITTGLSLPVPTGVILPGVSLTSVSPTGLILPDVRTMGLSLPGPTSLILLGVSPNGVSPTGVSPTGVSPTSVSPTGVILPVARTMCVSLPGVSLPGMSLPVDSPLESVVSQPSVSLSVDVGSSSVTLSNQNVCDTLGPLVISVPVLEINSVNMITLNDSDSMPRDSSLTQKEAVTERKMTRSEWMRKNRNDFHVMHAGVQSMMRIFEYLSVPSLLSATRVCRMWRMISLHQCLVRKIALALLVHIILCIR